MTDTRPALAHDYALMTPAPDGVDHAISDVMARHEAELDEALRPFGVALSDLLQPTWMRVVRFGDVIPLVSPSEARAAAEVARHGAEPSTAAKLASAGGCCGSGEACSSVACTDTPFAATPAVDGVYVTDLQRDSESFGALLDTPADEAGFEQPTSPMSGPRFGRGGVRGDDE